MDIQPFFTEEEKKQFFSKYKQLLRHLYSFLKKEDRRQRQMCIRDRVDEAGCGFGLLRTRQKRH